MVSYFGLSGKIVTRANQFEGLFKLSWKPVAYIFLLELDSEKTHGMITVEREMGTSYLIFSQKERLYLIIQHAAGSKIT